MIMALGAFMFMICSVAALYCYVTGIDPSFQGFWFGAGIYVGCVITQMFWEAYKWFCWKKPVEMDDEDQPL